MPFFAIGRKNNKKSTQALKAYFYYKAIKKGEYAAMPFIKTCVTIFGVDSLTISFSIFMPCR